MPRGVLLLVVALDGVVGAGLAGLEQRFVLCLRDEEVAIAVAVVGMFSIRDRGARRDGGSAVRARQWNALLVVCAILCSLFLPLSLSP